MKKFKPITLDDYVTASGTYPERLKSKELTAQVKLNAVELLKRVNSLLEFMGYMEPKVSSGFRPSSVNSKIGNASKKSAHMSGEAIDLLDDKDQTLCLSIKKPLLVKFDLYKEDSGSTIGVNTNWVHLQSRETSSGKRIFKP